MKRILLWPPQFTLLVSRNQGRVLKIVLMTLVFITALYTKEYRGNYQAIINSHIGGILYVLFGSLLFSVVFAQLRAWQSVLIAFTLTGILECIQYFRLPFLIELTRTKFFLYLLGNSFNPADFPFYVVGALAGWVVLVLVENLEVER